MENRSTPRLSASTAVPSRGKRGRTYVLIHGAWHGGWVWKPIADRLRAMGHSVYAPSLTGLGDRRHLLRPGINLDTHCDDIVNLIELENLEELVLVAWSYGGMVASDVLARITDKIASIVYLDAIAPEPGRTLPSYSKRAPQLEESVQLLLEGKDIPPLSHEAWGVTDRAVIDYVMPRLSPQPVMTYLQASKALLVRPSIPHTYVLADRTPSDTFRQFLKLFRHMPNAQTRVLDADHLLMLTAPDETLEILVNVG